ncbi:MAG: proline dehydrogenase family protein [Saprospiraceae bacterium]
MKMLHAKVSFDNTQTAFADKNNRDLRRIYYLFKLMNYPALLKFGMNLIENTIQWRWVQFIIRDTIFKQFVGGETLEECAQTAQHLRQSNIHTYIAYSVEGKKMEAEYERTTAETIETINFAQKHDIPFAVFKVTGLAEFALLEKVQSGAPLSDAEKAAFERVRARVDRICRRGYETKVRVLVDAEETWIQDVIDALANEMMEKYNKEAAIIYNTIQMYRKAGLSLLQKSYERAVEKGYYLGVKQVRGAYLVKESERAARLGYENPINPTKAATDKMYNDALRFTLQRLDRIALLAGTHNEESCYELMQLTEELNIPTNHPNIFVGQLYGMSDNISYNMAKAGFNAIKYVPYGSVKDVIPYLFRRAQENSAIAGQGNREYHLVNKEVQRRKNEG